MNTDKRCRASSICWARPFRLLCDVVGMNRRATQTRLKFSFVRIYYVYCVEVFKISMFVSDTRALYYYGATETADLSRELPEFS